MIFGKSPTSLLSRSHGAVGLLFVTIFATLPMMKPERASALRWAAGAVLFLFICLPAAARTHGSSPGEIRVTRIEHTVTEDRVRVVVRFDAAVQYVGGTATDPFRIFFDLRGTHPAAALAARAPVGDTLVQRIRVAQYQPGITRMVLDLSRPAPYTATFLANPPRLVIEVLRAPGIMREAHTSSRPAPSALSIPTPVAPALAPERMPPSPPQVTYANGLLTIVASNSTLSDILRAVAAQTGAMLDAPPSMAAERVSVRLGPARPLDVVADLLAGLDYIVVGASNDPEAISNIIVSPNTASSLPPEPARQHPVAQYQPPPPEPEEAPAPEPSPPAPQAKTPATPADQVPQQEKTPEELLEELRKKQEQQPPHPQQPQQPQPPQ
ncbi:MAG: AMIN domain-containing protein [Terriglobales bacterium]